MASVRRASVVFFWNLFVISSIICTDVSKNDQKSILICVLNPSNAYHAKKAELLKENVEGQFENNEKLLKPHVLLLHEENIKGAWAVLPLLKRLVEKCNICTAIIFCDENIEINLQKLTEEFLKLDFNMDIFGGRTLQDSNPTIVHHYNFKNDISFKYADISAGFFLSMSLLKKLSDRFDRSTAKIDFSIDAFYELSQFIYDEGKGVNLTTFDFVCGVKEKSQKCALTCGNQNPSCNEFKVRNEDVVIAVKTCQKFHESRIPVVIKTWGSSVRNILYFSDVANESIPTQYVGVPNTEGGHCKKFFIILEKSHEIIERDGHKWLYVVDDDSLISFKRLLDLLSCYNPQDFVYLGERYGYGVVSGHGYDYITLGGGMAISRKGLEKIMKSGACSCSKDDSPDDMTLGMCLLHLDLPVTHSPLFHQARPTDYSEAYLENQLPISFHRHWENDPYQVYDTWLKVDVSTDDGNDYEPRSDL